jgi:hypothetical protein
VPSKKVESFSNHKDGMSYQLKSPKLRWYHPPFPLPKKISLSTLNTNFIIEICLVYGTDLN